jgi:hypothetical protein
MAAAFPCPDTESRYVIKVITLPVSKTVLGLIFPRHLEANGMEIVFWKDRHW